MKPTFAILIVAFIASGTIGCSMCCGPYDYDYPTFGGKHERADRAYGRVGSLFSDPYASYNGESADESLEHVRAMSDSTSSKKRSNGSGADRDIEKFKQELDDRRLEPVNPRKKPTNGGNGNIEQLPPPDDVGSDPTAMRPWRQRSHRDGQIYNR